MKREPNASENEVMNIARASENSQLVVNIWKSDEGDFFGIWRQIPGQTDRTLGLLPTDMPIVARFLSVIALQFSHLEYLDQSLRDELGCVSHCLATTLGFNPEALIPAELRKVKV